MSQDLFKPMKVVTNLHDSSMNQMFHMEWCLTGFELENDRTLNQSAVLHIDNYISFNITIVLWYDIECTIADVFCQTRLVR